MEIHLTLSFRELANLISTVDAAIRFLEYTKVYTLDHDKAAQIDVTISDKKKLLSRLQSFLPSDTLCPLSNNTKDGKNEDEKVSR